MQEESSATASTVATEEAEAIGPLPVRFDQNDRLKEAYECARDKY